MANDSLLTKLEAARKELLDLGLRNPLLNYRASKSRGITIIKEKSSFIFDILVNHNKAMSFLADASKGDGKIEFAESDLSEAELLETYTDSKLQTNESDTTLQTRLLNTYYSARTSLEEQGVNILYIALGALHWYETDKSGEERLAPLLLIPVELERSSARDKFRVKYSLEEIGANISLQAKLKTDFGLVMPDLPEVDDLDVNSYFSAVQKIVSKQSQWCIEENAIELGFFSFGKFMIYNDLDSKKWPEKKKPIDHSLLNGVLGQGFKVSMPAINNDTHIDRDTKAHELFQVVDADSSQLHAILAARDGHSLVIQGPPGTGKSQTIANIIGDAVGQGKKVLFVAEKMAALEVVKRRLDSVSIGESCLELHSHKANKKELHKELRRILELGKPVVDQLKHEVSLLEKHKNELNDYCEAVNRRVAKSNLTTNQLIGNLLDLIDKNDLPLPKIELKNLIDWDRSRMAQAEHLADQVEARLKEIGVPSDLLFWGCKLTLLLPREEGELSAILTHAKQSIDVFIADLESTCKYIGLPIPTDRNTLGELSNSLKVLSEAPTLTNINIISPLWSQHEGELSDTLKACERLKDLYEKYDTIFIPEAWEYDVIKLREELRSNGEKWYKFLISSYKNAVRQLTSLCKGALPSDNVSRIQYVDHILESKRLVKSLKENEELAKNCFGSNWKSVKSDVASLQRINHYLNSIHKAVSIRTLPKEVITYLARNEDPSAAKTHNDNLSDRAEHYYRDIKLIVDKLAFNEFTKFSGVKIIDQAFTKIQALVNNWIVDISEVYKAISWNVLSKTASELDLEGITNAAITWESAVTHLKLSVQKTWYDSLFEHAIINNFPLQKFERASHEELSRQFARMDKLNLQYNQAKAAFKHWETVPRNDGPGQLNVLRREFNKKARFLPIRRVMEDAGLAVQAIKPVFMMSPMSIANFLPPGAVEFDVVIFDEASQVRPVDALGAILRGKQLIVVGDTKQLPPTSFFDSLSDASTNDEANVTADVQSILGLCDSQGMSSTMLRWHYRSRHESLISLSNHEFYENKLVIFPSPGSKKKSGLFMNYLKDTVYDRGKTRTNPQEADKVVEAVVNHARQNPELTLGVVAFSTAQREAIQDRLELKRKSNPDIEEFFRKHPHEPFFIKNLENVQGDERDVIFISIGYGRAEEGYLAMSFGPLNNEGGERRLNVLITRAKSRCEIFTNIKAEDIDTDRTKSYGVRTLKHFLYFAEHGRLDVPIETGLPSESPFEENVADNLIRHGYVVRKQIGSKGFFIDLAIVDKANPGRYILGIECDGAAYHSSKSARDRDRLRQQVLESIGWRIHRVWSTDWFKNRDRELKRLIEAIEIAHQKNLIDDETSAERQEDKPFVARIETADDQSEIAKYEMAKISKEIAQVEFHLHASGKLANWIIDVVKIESPVHFEEVSRRLGEASGVGRIGNRIKESLDNALKVAIKSKTIRFDKEFLWLKDMKFPVVRDRADLPTTSRKLSYIAPEELSVAIEKVVRNSFAIGVNEAVPVVARMFGFLRVTEKMKQGILEAIDSSVKKKIVLKDGELLKPIN
jgi:very-short-patch-repair endonuclease/DNA polymerase III delta prime subunit